MVLLVTPVLDQSSGLSRGAYEHEKAAQGPIMHLGLFGGLTGPTGKALCSLMTHLELLCPDHLPLSNRGPWEAIPNHVCVCVCIHTSALLGVGVTARYRRLLCEPVNPTIQIL